MAIKPNIRQTAWAIKPQTVLISFFKWSIKTLRKIENQHKDVLTLEQQQKVQNKVNNNSTTINSE